MNVFKVGDIIEITKSCDDFYKFGAKGEVVGIDSEDDLIVSFSSGVFSKESSSWYVLPENAKLIDKAEVN